MAKRKLSVLKRIRQNQKRRERNKAVRSEIKTYYKKTIEAINKNEMEKAEEYLRTFTSKIDKAVKKGIIHRNESNRKKSRLMKLINRKKKVA